MKTRRRAAFTPGHRPNRERHRIIPNALRRPALKRYGCRAPIALVQRRRRGIVVETRADQFASSVGAAYFAPDGAWNLCGFGFYKDIAPDGAWVERVLAAKRADPTADTPALEREIDQRVYRLYLPAPRCGSSARQAGGLTPDEIKRVKENVRK